MQHAGNLGYFGFTTDSAYNRKVVKANKLVDKYNENVSTIEGIKTQMDYQGRMKKQMNKILFG